MNLVNKLYKYCDNSFLKNLTEKKLNTVNFSLKQFANFKSKLIGKNCLVVWSRRTTIQSNMVGIYFLVYNGKNFTPVLIRDYMVGFKIGDFVLTKNLGYKIHMKKK